MEDEERLSASERPRLQNTANTSSYDRRPSVQDRRLSARFKVRPLPETSLVMAHQLQSRLVTSSSKTGKPQLEIGKRKKSNRLVPLPTVGKVILIN